MNHTPQLSLTPKLRFPEFRRHREWEERPLGQVVEVASGQVDPTESPYCNLPHVGGENIESDSGNLLNLRSAREDGVISGKYPFDEMDILYSKIRPGLNKVASPDFNGICSADIYPIRPANGDIYRDYLVHLLRSKSFVEYATKHSDRGKIPKINRETLIAYPAPLPSPAEQQKIADCLTSLDELIAAQGRKVAALQAHKQGLMQQLFPREAETHPRLRFPEFRDGPDWEVKEVGDVFRVTRGLVLAMPLLSDTKSEATSYPVYSSQTKNLGLAGYYSEFLYEDAITWTTDGANAGDVNYRSGKFYCTNVCGVLSSDGGQANQCTAALINAVSRNHVSYVGNPKLMNGVMAKITVPFPSLAEQQRIADCLSAHDAQITAEADKLAALKTHKQGLMQQLFPSPEGANR